MGGLIIFGFIYGIFLIALIVKYIRFRFREPAEAIQKTQGLAGFEVIFVVIAPLIGFVRQAEYDNDMPFHPNHLPAVILLWLTAVIAFWTSRLGAGRLPPVLEALVPAGLLQGSIFCLISAIHMGPMTLIGVAMPFFGFEMVAPLMGFIILTNELWLYHYQVLERFRANPLSMRRRYSRSIMEFVLAPFWNRFPFLAFLMLPILIIQEIILLLIGQEPDAFIQAFTDSCGFVLSQGHNCPGPPPPSHYLCTVATHGNPKLVRPVREGLRRGSRIIVTRQLLIANAFEQWLEEHAPNFARRLRRFYDRLDIPVERWARSRRRANLIYILMKPLEWFFLIWLYTFDHKPEDRIAKQYLPDIPKNQHPYD